MKHKIKYSPLTQIGGGRGGEAALPPYFCICLMYLILFFDVLLIYFQYIQVFRLNVSVFDYFQGGIYALIIDLTIYFILLLVFL